MQDRLNELHLQQKLQENRIKIIERDHEAKVVKDNEFQVKVYEEIASLRKEAMEETANLKTEFQTLRKTIDKWFQRIFGGVIAITIMYAITQFGLDNVMQQILSRL